MAYSAETAKIDSLAVNGLLGVNNSLAYKVHEIEKHFHSREVWFGRHTSISAGVNEGEAWSVVQFESTSGASSTFGAWVPLLGTSDTPFQATYAKFDPHRIIIPDVHSDASKKGHLVQLCWGSTDAATAFGDGDYTGFWALPERDGKASPVDVHCPRIAAGTKMWLRHLVIDNAGTLSMEFYFGLHEYAG
jgi:hypothetical protein